MQFRSMRVSLVSMLIAVVITMLTEGVEGGMNERSVEWLKENGKKDGVVTLDSGLQYKVLRKGDGRFHPAVGTSCSCHYEGTLIDGTKFDSSYDRGQPTSFAPNQVIKGWTEAMQLMVAGDKWELYIPSDLAYGDRGSPPKIGGGEALVFQMEIIQVPVSPDNVFICDLETKEGCTEKELAYLQKSKNKFSMGDADEIDEELERLVRVSNSHSKQHLKDWAHIRSIILESLKKSEDGDDEF